MSPNPAPPALTVAQLPLPALVVDPVGQVSARSVAAGLRPELPAPGTAVPAGWLAAGPLARVRSGAPTDSGLLALAPGGPFVTVACSAVPSGVLCLFTGADSAAPVAPTVSSRQRLLEEVVSLAGVGGWEVDLATRTPLWTDEVCRIHEVPPGTVPDLAEAIDYYAPEARPLIRGALEEGLTKGTEWDLELPLITAKGRRIWVRARGRPIFQDGVCTRLLGSFEDITERRAAQEAMRAALARKRVAEALFQNSNAMLAVIDSQGRFERVNRRWTTLLGWAEDELVGQPVVSRVHPDDLVATAAAAQRLSSGASSTERLRVRYRCRDGRTLTLLWVAASDPETGLLYAVVDDVTEERERVRQAERLAMIAARTTNAVLFTDARGRIEWVNASFTRITGYSAEEALGSNPGALLQGPDTDPDAVAEMGARIRARQPFTTEVRNYAKDGRPYWIAIEALPIFDDDGAFQGFMAVEADITDQKDAQAALIRERDRATQLAREAGAEAAAKSGFLAMMSHELRTPMNGILGTAQLLLDGRLDAEQARLVQTLHDAGRGLLSLLNDVLDYSKLDSNQFGLDRNSFDLGALATHCVDLFQAEANRTGIELSLALDPAAAVSVFGDELRLRQVLVNLLGNALKFTSRGRVQLSVDRGPDDTLRFAVHDTGIGIPAEQGARLFSPFTQVDASARRRFGGTGLGLAISQRIVGLMGGTIAVESVVGEGSTFSFCLTLPEGCALEHTGPVPVATGAELVGLAVLLVEDNPINGLVGRKMLERLGCTVQLVTDGEQAVAVVQESPPDIVLMDCHMPVMDGWAATRAIRHLEATEGRSGRLPVIAQTASCMADEVARCHAVGMDAVLPKPLELDRLRSLLLAWGRQDAA